jgi:heme A synthase
MKTKRWASLALTAVVCLIVEGALVAGFAAANRCGKHRSRARQGRR